MIEILTRGKCDKTGKWVEGYYVRLTREDSNFKELSEDDPGKYIHRILYEKVVDPCISSECFWRDVLPKTLGRYIGVNDKNDKKIFEGDIIKSCKNDGVYFVKYCASSNYPAFDVVPKVNFVRNGLSHLCDAEGVEVIGNIHDNPELLDW